MRDRAPGRLTRGLGLSGPARSSGGCVTSGNVSGSAAAAVRARARWAENWRLRSGGATGTRTAFSGRRRCSPALPAPVPHPRDGLSNHPYATWLLDGAHPWAYGARLAIGRSAHVDSRRRSGAGRVQPPEKAFHCDYPPVHASGGGITARSHSIGTEQSGRWIGFNYEPQGSVRVSQDVGTVSSKISQLITRQGLTDYLVSPLYK